MACPHAVIRAVLTVALSLLVSLPYCAVSPAVLPADGE
jgi:hypothetical protein